MTQWIKHQPPKPRKLSPVEDCHELILWNLWETPICYPSSQVGLWRLSLMVSSLKVHEFNICVPEVFLLGSTLFLPCIIDLPKSILRSLANIYADGTSDFRWTFKYMGDQSLAADFSSCITLTGKDCLVSFNTSKTKLVTFRHHWTDPKTAQILVKGYTLK